MEIRIDTSKDSKEDIRKVISLLSQIVESPPSEQEKNFEVPPVQEGMFGMFDSAPVANTAQPVQTAYARPVTSDLIPSYTQTQEKTSAPQFNDPMQVLFDKNDTDLEEVQKLNEKSKTKGSDLRIIAYK